MADDKLAALLATQQSLTEWLQDIEHADAAAFRREDNEKRNRLRILHDEIGLPFDQPVKFQATDLRSKTPELVAYVDEHGDELCALRLMPNLEDLPKLRMRGKSVRNALVWFDEQDIDPANYRAEFIPHIENSNWATIFIVNKHGIQGEIVVGGHHQLTQGFHDAEPPYVFQYDFETWSIHPANDAALGHLKTLATHLLVEDAAHRQNLEKSLHATFTHDYLEGYFETTDSIMGTWFIDYSPMLGKMYANIDIQPTRAAGLGPTAIVAGQTGCGGTAEGVVKIIDPDNLDADVPDGFILVCQVTTPKYVPLMQKAAAIVTDQGGILSHAAIVARELKKPCIVGTGKATTALHDGQTVAVDADKGVVVAG